MMPNVDGYELTRALRADERHRSVPIVMLTSKDARIDRLFAVSTRGPMPT